MSSIKQVELNEHPMYYLRRRQHVELQLMKKRHEDWVESLMNEHMCRTHLVPRKINI